MSYTAAGDPLITSADLSLDLLAEILSYFPLENIENYSIVSKTLQSACNKHTRHLFSLLREEGRKVICETPMKSINGCIGVIDDPYRTNSTVCLGGMGLGVKVTVLTGAIETIIIQAQHLNPFITSNQLLAEEERLNRLDSTIDESNGSVFRFVIHNLMLAAGKTSDAHTLDVVRMVPNDPRAEAWHGDVVSCAMPDKISSIFSRESVSVLSNALKLAS